MSHIKEIKNNPDNNIGFVETISLFYPGIKSKYIDLLLRIMKNESKTVFQKDKVIDYLSSYFNIKDNMDELKKMSDLKLEMMGTLIYKLGGEKEWEMISQFIDYNERGIIEENDLSKYKSISDMEKSNNVADIINLEKKMSAQIRKVYEDEEWLIIRPLTPLSSKKYGANTKWCTTSGEGSYFFDYASRGSLIYTINKLTGLKVATFKYKESRDGVSFWNDIDNKVDSIETGLPVYIVVVIMTEIAIGKANLDFLSENDKHDIMISIYDINKKVHEPLNLDDVGLRQPVRAIEEELGRRVNDMDIVSMNRESRSEGLGSLVDNGHSNGLSPLRNNGNKPMY